MRNYSKIIPALILCVLLLSNMPRAARAFAPPVATSFSIAVPVSAQSVIQLQGSDPDSTPLTFATTSSPSHGTLSNLDASTGALVYTPTAGYTGSDSFQFTVTSGGDTSSAATVTITVTAAKTRIVDTLLNPDETPRSGKVTFILTQQATSPAGLIPAKSTVSATLTSAGQFDVSVFPSRALSPQQYYQVWFVDTSGQQNLIGIYDVPASTTTITLSPYRVTDTNLAARYTFVSEAALRAALRAGSSQFLLGSDATGDLFYRAGSGLVTRLAIGGEGDLLTVESGVPVWKPAASSDSMLSEIVAYWKMDESGASPRFDTVGTSDFTPSVSFAAVGGKILNAPGFFDGAGRYLSVADNASVSGGAGDLTIAGWVYVDLATTSAAPGLVAKWGSSSGDKEYLLYWNRTGSNKFHFAVQGGATQTDVTATMSTVSLSQWYYVAAWHDADDEEICVQVDNGSPACTAHTTGINDGSAALQVGAINGGDLFTGRVDELGIWRRLLTTNERTALYNAGDGLSHPFSGTAELSRTYSYNVVDDFHASGSAQATTGSISASSTSLTVASAIDFERNQSLLVAGAGAGGVDLVAKIVSISGTTITLGTAAGTTVSSVLVRHDDAAAFQAANDACYARKGAKIQIPAGYYYWGGTITASSNSLVTFPANATSESPYTCVWEGEVTNHTSENARPTTGVVIDVSRVAGSGTVPAALSAGAYLSTTGGLTNFNYVSPDLRNIYFRGASNPTTSLLNLHQAINAALTNIQADTGVWASIAEPTTASATAIILPGVNNHAQIKLQSVSILGGWYTGIILSEHARLDDIYIAKLKRGIHFEGGCHLNTGVLTISEVVTPLYAPDVPGGGVNCLNSTVRFEMNVERDPGSSWYSAQSGQDVWAQTAGNIRGKVFYKLTIAGTGNTTSDLSTTNTSTYLRFENLYTGNAH